MTQLIKRDQPLSKTKSQLDYLLLDVSGSMSSKWDDILAAIDAYFTGVKSEGIHSQVLLQAFNGFDSDHIALDAALPDIVSVRQARIHPKGGSPLYDAINLMCRRLRDLDPPICSIVVATDGYENMSQYTDETQARALLDWCRAKGWQVTFIGVDFNNSSQARKLGATDATAIGVTRARLTDATTALAKKRGHYGRTGEDMEFSDGEKQQFGGYLNAPGAAS